MRRFRGGGVGFEFFDQVIVGARLTEGVPHVERHQEQQRHDGHVVRGRSDFPKLVPVA